MHRVFLFSGRLDRLPQIERTWRVSGSGPEKHRLLGNEVPWVSACDCYPFAFLSAGIPRGFRLSFTCKKFKIDASNLSKSSFKRVRSLGK